MEDFKGAWCFTMIGKILMGLIFLMCLIAPIQATYSYQENANASWDEDTGWASGSANTYDGNWTTYSVSTLTGRRTSSRVFEYAKPTNADISTKWNVMDGIGTAYLTFTAGCWANNASGVRVKATSFNDGDFVTDNAGRWYCWDGSWVSLRSNTGEDAVKIYEEGMNWSITASAVPQEILFISPSPYNNSIISTGQMALNTSIQITNLTTVKTNLNGANYTIFGSDLIAAYNLDNVSAIGDNATNAVDLSANSYNGTITNAVWIANGKWNKALYFDGSGDKVEGPGMGRYLNASSAFSAEGWFNTTTTSGFKIAWISRGATNNRAYLAMNGGAWYACIQNNSGQECCLDTANIIVPNYWSHVSVTFNGSDSGNLTIYVNGAKSASTQCGSGYTILRNLSDDVFRLGYNAASAPTHAWAGPIDEVRLWNRTLSATEINLSYNSNFRKTGTDNYYLFQNIPNIPNGSYSFYTWANTSLNNNHTTGAYTIYTSGLVASAYYSNGTPATNWNITITNGTTTFTNSSLTNPASWGYLILPNGNVNVSIGDGSSSLYYLNNISAQTINSSNLITLNVTLYEKPANTVSLSSSLGWNLFRGQTPTLTCSALSGSYSLYIQGTGVSSPYSFPVNVGTYTVSCNSSETALLAPSNASGILIVSDFPGCTNSSAYAFSSNITTATNITTLNLTALVSLGYVRSDLKDVYALNVSGAWVNLTGASGQYFIVNNTNKTSFTLQFGNYLINNTYSSASINNTQNLTIYSGINPYALINIFDEINYTSSYPPSTTVIAGLFCSGGQNYFTITPNTTTVLIALTSQPTRVSLRPQYSALDYYQRAQYNFANQSIYLFDFYLADGISYLVVPVTFIMQDVDKQGYLLQVYRTIGAQTQIITEGYFDVSGSDTESLIQGIDYNLRARSPSGVYYNLGTVNAPGAVTKYLFTSTQNLTPGLNYSSSLIHVDAAFSPNSSIALANITVNYTDLSYALSTVTVTIYNDTGVANTSIIANTWNFSTVMLYGANTSKNYYVKYTIRTPTGSVTMGKIVSGTFTGFNLGLPSVWLQIMGIAIIFFVMLAIGSPNQIMSSGIIIIAVMALEMGMGWLILDSGQLLILGILLILGMGIAYVSRGER
jgi:hypothetical protein